jgi:hypothetical protein
MRLLRRECGSWKIRLRLPPMTTLRIHHPVYDNSYAQQ